MKNKYIFLLLIFLSCSKENKNTISFIDEPPTNTYLANSSWPISHANCYAQASSPFPGPSNKANLMVNDFEPLLPGLITLAISGKYPNGQQVIWGNTIGTVFKATNVGKQFKIFNQYIKPGVGIADLFSIDNAVSGAYTLVDKDNVFYVPKGYEIFAYTDAVKNDPSSAIILKNTFQIPEIFRKNDERIVGLNLTYDGMLVFASNNGLIGITDRNFTSLKTYQLPADEKISNSIACDEEGGIYIVSSKNMYRVQWTGTELTTDENKGGWMAAYEAGGTAGGIRLGDGSGSTPTLMGTGTQDKFVVITDGQDLMHVVLFWRDKIPTDWQQLEGTKSRRIAAQYPVKFGNALATKSLSEQSVCIRGNGILVVNNLLKNTTNNRLLDLLLSGVPANAPYGAEKFEWNNTTKKLTSTWVNNQVSFPNGIPCMSAATNTIYNIGQKNGKWTFDALDWTTGQFKFQYILGNQINFNSAYAPTEIGINGAIYSGTLLGMVGLWNK